MEDIQEALRTKLKTITSGNGYETDVKEVYSDKIPMGLDLAEFEVPCILLIAGDDKAVMKQQCRYGNWHMELQLWHNGDVGDGVMQRFVRDVYKAVFAGSPTATINNAFRAIHPAIYDVTPGPIRPDLNMIDANRCYWITLVLHYSSRLYDL